MEIDVEALRAALSPKAQRAYRLLFDTRERHLPPASVVPPIAPRDQCSSFGTLPSPLSGGPARQHELFPAPDWRALQHADA